MTLSTEASPLWSRAALLEQMRGRSRHPLATPVRSISIDTRTIEPGGCSSPFVAKRGMVMISWRMRSKRVPPPR